jgi:1-acyl-sn-glycerol-3-phosphate acyltransferase
MTLPTSSSAFAPTHARPSFGAVVRSLAFTLGFYAVTLAVLISIPVCLLLPRPAIMWLCNSWSGAHRWLVVRVLGMTVVIEGAMPEGPKLVVLKHESMFEAIDMPCLLPDPGVFAKVELMQLPLWGQAAHRYGLVAVARDQGAKALRAMIKAARVLSDSGRPLAIFVEGTRVPHGTAPALQSGFAGIYKLIGLPVVPVAVNSGPIYRPFWKRRGTITYRIGEVIPPGLPRAELEERVHTAINALNTL